MGKALLVMDVQAGIVDRLKDKEGYISKVKAAVQAARSLRVAVIFVVVGFREGFPEVSSRNKTFSHLRDTAPDWLIGPEPLIEPTPGEVVVTKKHRISAFAGSDLEIVLRALEVDHLVLAGVSTSGVVLSTTREAADKDFQITILSDLCADVDEEVHRVLMEKVFPRQATVMASENWLN